MQLNFLSCFLFVLLAQMSGQSLFAAQRQGPDAAAYVYYDYIDPVTGLLAGGKLKADPNSRFDTQTISSPVRSESYTAQSNGPDPSTTLVMNGPVSNRVNIVVVGDGFTAHEMGIYYGDVDQFVSYFFTVSPFDEYQNYFNVHRVDVTSIDSGVSNDPVNGVKKNTALDAQFYCLGLDRRLCVDVNKTKMHAASAPKVDQIIALANSTTYGGAAMWGNAISAVSGGNPWSREIGVHEFGHAFALLADEYDTGGPASYVGEEPQEPNVSTMTASSLSSRGFKWFAWLGDSGVWSFEGAKYSLHGLYRPTFNSKMRTLGQPFDQINTEQFIMQIYNIVNPIDHATPTGTYKETQVFEVSPLRPAGRSLAIQWFVDDKPVSGANGGTFNFGAVKVVKDQKYSVKVVVVDDTPLVRDEAFRAARMRDERQWSVIASTTTVQPPTSRHRAARH